MLGTREYREILHSELPRTTLNVRKYANSANLHAKPTCWHVGLACRFEGVANVVGSCEGQENAVFSATNEQSQIYENM